MNERRLEFRVGLLAIVASGIAIYMTLQFGQLGRFWQPTYTVMVQFERAPGVYIGTPVKINGVKIGRVQRIQLNRTGVRLALEIDEQYFVARDAEVSLSRGLLGDTTLLLHRGAAQKRAGSDDVLAGRPYLDPMTFVRRMERSVSTTLASIESTSTQWGQVGKSINGLMGGRQGKLEKIIAESAESLQAFSVAMKAFSESAHEASTILGDPQNQKNLRRTLAAIPKLIEQTQGTITAVHQAVTTANENLANLAATTKPLAKRSTEMAIRLDATLTNIETISQELSELAQLANNKNGTIRALAADASLYRNLNQSAESLSVLLTNLSPVLRDLRIFSDKIARHPELLGVGGAFSGSDGTKPVRPANFERPQRK